MSGIRLVCFDWGGVILRICRSWAEGCAAAGLEVRGPDDPALAAARRQVALRYQCGHIDCATFHRDLALATGGRYSEDEVRRIHDAWLIEEYPGMAELVGALAASPGIETGLLSNTNAGHWRRHLPGPHGPHFPTAGRLKHRHASHLLGMAKPDAGIYRLFEEKTGFRGADVLFFDDLEENVGTARTVGWRAEQIDPTGDTALQIGTHLARYGIRL